MSTDNDPRPDGGQDAPPDPTPTPEPTPPPEGGQDPWADPTAARAEIERLRREAAQYRTKAKELEPMAAKAKELEDQGKTELERLTGQLTEATGKADAATTELHKLKVALAKAPPGVDLGRIQALAARLQGATVEELEADAADLFAQLGPTAAPPGGAGRPPVESLKPGAAPPNTSDTPLPQQIAAAEQAGEWAKARELKAMQLAQLHDNQKST